jgi:hypothetical protein
MDLYARVHGFCVHVRKPFKYALTGGILEEILVPCIGRHSGLR